MPNQRHQLVFGVWPGAGREDVENDDSIGRATDQCHGIVEAPAENVGHRGVLALSHADDAVTHGELPGGGGGAAGNEFADHREIVLFRQYRPDTDQRQTHRNVEILGRAWRHVAGVWFERHRVGVHEDLEGIFVGQSAQALVVVGVALVECLGDARVVLAGEAQA